MPGIFEAEAVGHLRDGFSGRQSVLTSRMMNRQMWLLAAQFLRNFSNCLIFKFQIRISAEFRRIFYGFCVILYSLII